MKKSSLILLLLISLLLRASDHKYPSFDFSNNPYNTAFKSNSRYTQIGSADVNLATGHFTMQKNLLTLPGRGDLSPSLTLSYLSALASYPGRVTPETTYTGQPIDDSTFVILDLPGAGGIGWNVIMGEMVVTFAGGDYGWLRLGDGVKHQIVSYGGSAEFYLVDKPDWNLEWYEFDSLWGMLLTSPEGIRYVFDRWYFIYDGIGTTFLTLTKIIDRFGNYIKIDYCGEDTISYGCVIVDSTISVEKMRHIEKITSPTGDSAVFHYSDDSLYLENISYWNSDGEEVNIKFEYQLDTLEEAISIWRGDTVKLLSSVGYYDSFNQLLYPEEEFEYNDIGLLSTYHYPYGGIEEYSFEVVADTTIVLMWGDDRVPGPVYDTCFALCNRLSEINIRQNCGESGNKYTFWYGDGEGEWDSRNSPNIISSVHWHILKGDTLPTYAPPMFKAVKLERPDSSYTVYSFTDKLLMHVSDWNKIYLMGVFEDEINYNSLGDTLGRLRGFLKNDNYYIIDPVQFLLSNELLAIMGIDTTNLPGDRNIEKLYFASSAGQLIERDGIKTFTAFMTENVQTGEIMIDTVVQVTYTWSNPYSGRVLKRKTVAEKARVAKPVYASYQAVLHYGDIDSVSFNSDSTDFEVEESNANDNWRKRVGISYSNSSPRVYSEEILNDSDSGDVVLEVDYEYDWNDRINNGNYGNICNYDSLYAFDELNALVQTQVGDGPKTDVWYDKVGNVIKTSYGGVFTRYEFDASTEYSRPSKKIDIISDTDFLITEFSYYPNTGLLQEVTDPNGNTTTYKYDELGRIIKVVKPGDNINSPTIGYGYDDSSKKKWSKVKGEEKMYTFYDGLGRKIQTQRKDSQ
ncbi:RHS repeat protein, partial [candidate division WOR-3 bacterium]|nr:RHS repeat protein [candidate division WOR-3 bacterium]